MNNSHLKSCLRFMRNTFFGASSDFSRYFDPNPKKISGQEGRIKMADVDSRKKQHTKVFRHGRHLAIFILASVVLGSSSVLAARISDIKNTKHNLSINGPGAVKVFDASGMSSTTLRIINGASSVDVPISPLRTKQNQICVFCHTPHGATLGVSPLWNRKISSAVYTTYTSSSLDAETIYGALAQPGGSSKLCLSCHDGTLAIGNVNVMWGRGATDSQLVTTPSEWKMIMLGTEGYDTTTFLNGKMPYGGYGAVSGVSGIYSGYTRDLGIDLKNDHPISVTYTHDLAVRDGELRDLTFGGAQSNNQKYPTTGSVGSIIGVRGVSGYHPRVPLEPTGSLVGSKGQIQCSACHDPHLYEDNPALGNQKFLILNRFQEGTQPTYPSLGANFDPAYDISCVACHDKNNGVISVWAKSAHANPQVATPNYSDTAADMNEFPASAVRGVANGNLPVWQASCLNCHDTHTVQGARWLLREGTDNPPNSYPKSGGNSAIEETCFQCHTSITDPNAAIQLSVTTTVPDIKSDYAAGNKHMPLRSNDQGGGATEVHDIGGNFNDVGLMDCSGLTNTNKCGADGVEQRTNLGAGGNLNNRHAECTDCHNPHRTVKFQSFLGNPVGSLSGNPDAEGTHKHTDAVGYTHDNLISGALRGTFGVEPIYGLASFASLPTSYTPKHGDPGANTSTLTNAAYVTREYQICLKCHSDYGYSDDNGTDSGTTTRPPLATTGGGNLTLGGTSGGPNMDHYTNQAKEFQAPIAHQAEPTGLTGSGAGALYEGGTQVNYRSWHPVQDVTGRTTGLRGMIAFSPAFNLPWSNAVGTQTMYCSDCHGSNVAAANSVIPNAGTPRSSWGPHGSTNDFILKGQWDGCTGSTGSCPPSNNNTNGLCFKCHDYASYAGPTPGMGGTGQRTGFYIAASGVDGHQLHVDRVGARLDGGPASRCDWCHVAVPHGWKNKGLLVNLNDVGPEAKCGGVPCAVGTEVQVLAASGIGYNNPPYYMNARLKVLKFQASGTWTAADCGSKTNSPGIGNGQVGINWMTANTGISPDTTENCATPP